MNGLALFVWILSISVAAIASINGIITLRRNRHLLFLKSYLVFFVVGGLIQKWFFHAKNYKSIYWTTNEISDLLLFLASVELVFTLIRSLVSRWQKSPVMGATVLVVLLLMAVFRQHIPLLLSISLNVVAGFILLMIFL